MKRPFRWLQRVSDRRLQKNTKRSSRISAAAGDPPTCSCARSANPGRERTCFQSAPTGTSCSGGRRMGQSHQIQDLPVAGGSVKNSRRETMTFPG